MKHELEHFHIGDSYGGNQDWFPTFMMRVGGCGAETACDSSIYFALHRGLTKIAPENAPALNKKDYIRFAYQMRPYLSPRASGIDRPETYVEGYARYLRDRGETRLSMTCLDGAAPFEAARDAVAEQIGLGLPIPTLVLKHRSQNLQDYVWHWFLINGWDDSEHAFMVKAVTYGSCAWLDLRELWDTGYERRGGFVLYHIDDADRPRAE